MKVRELAVALLQIELDGASGFGRAAADLGRHADLAAALRDDVTTPAGCTIGGLLMLEDGRIRSVLARAVEEATRSLRAASSAEAICRPAPLAPSPCFRSSAIRRPPDRLVSCGVINSRYPSPK